MFHSAYKMWPEQPQDESRTKPSLILLHLKAIKFAAISYMEIPVSHYSEEELKEIIKILEFKRMSINAYAMNEPERFWHFLHHLFEDFPILVGAYDIMGWDIWSQLYKTSFRQLIRLPEKKRYEYTQLIKPEEQAEVKDENAYCFIEANKFEEAIQQLELKDANVLMAMNKPSQWDLVKILREKGVKSIWVEPSERLLKILKPEQMKEADGISLDPLKLQGFTPMINLLMELRKQNIPVGSALKEGSIVSKTAYAQFAPVFQKLFFNKQSHLLPATGILINDQEIVFPEAAGMGLAYENNFW